ncbi:MAG: glutamate racemase [Longicatena sp.]
MKQNDKAIGVFDSGLGGISVVKELQKQMPNENFIYYGDSEFAPYGTKKKEEIMKRCIQICEFFLVKEVKAIVIACNTATSACVNELRELYPRLPIVGMEPALKLAAQRKSEQTIMVMATPFTLKEKKFADLMAIYEQEHNIIKLPCPALVQIVEHNELDNEELVQEQLNCYFSEYDLKKVDSIVLGCTHFVFFRKQIQNMLGSSIALVDGNIGTARHLKDILANLDEENMSGYKGTIKIYNSTKDDSFIDLSKKLLARDESVQVNY